MHTVNFFFYIHCFYLGYIHNRPGQCVFFFVYILKPLAHNMTSQLASRQTLRGNPLCRKKWTTVTKQKPVCLAAPSSPFQTHHEHARVTTPQQDQQMQQTASSSASALLRPRPHSAVPTTGRLVTAPPHKRARLQSQTNPWPKKWPQQHTRPPDGHKRPLDGHKRPPGGHVRPFNEYARPPNKRPHLGEQQSADKTTSLQTLVGW